jgi:hypothetical protein
VTWHPDTNLDDHATDPSILDACHLDLVHPKTGQCLVTSENLLTAANSKITCLFLQKCQASSKVTLQAIQACPNLQCISLIAVVSSEILHALSKCHDLRGLTLSLLGVQRCTATDQDMASLLRACSKLKWLFVDSDKKSFAARSWSALDNGACPKLHVLWIDCTTNCDGRTSVTRGDHEVIRRALASRTQQLKLCMINPDNKLKSRFIIGDSNKKTDRLKGYKINIP